jgi:hypothetical protein
MASLLSSRTHSTAFHSAERTWPFPLKLWRNRLLAAWSHRVLSLCFRFVRLSQAGAGRRFSRLERCAKIVLKVKPCPGT